MAGIEFIKVATGQRLRIALDGSELRDSVDAPRVEWCDRGQHFASMPGGRYDGANGLNQLWLCQTCM